MAILNGWRITRTGIVFILGIIVLGGLVFGGIWLVHDRGEQARRQEAAKIAEQNLESQSEQTPASNETNSGTTEAPAATNTNTQTVATTAQTSSELPQTGADLSQIVILTVVTLAIAYYATSRRAARAL